MLTYNLGLNYVMFSFFCEFITKYFFFYILFNKWVLQYKVGMIYKNKLDSQIVLGVI